MQILIWFLYVIASLGAVSYFRMKLFNATIAVFCLLVLASVLGVIGELTWLAFLIVALPLNIESIRKQYISEPLLKIYKKINNQ